MGISTDEDYPELDGPGDTSGRNREAWEEIAQFLGAPKGELVDAFEDHSPHGEEPLPEIELADDGRNLGLETEEGWNEAWDEFSDLEDGT